MPRQNYPLLFVFECTPMYHPLLEWLSTHLLVLCLMVTSACFLSSSVLVTTVMPEPEEADVSESLSGSEE